jgi:hypothetical protein
MLGQRTTHSRMFTLLRAHRPLIPTVVSVESCFSARLYGRSPLLGISSLALRRVLPHVTCRKHRTSRAPSRARPNAV